MNIRVRPYNHHDADIWDRFVIESLQGTLLHTRSFLAYHGDRFTDLSLLVEDSGKVLGLLPAARSPYDKNLVISHPGITYGGVIHKGDLRGGGMIESLKQITQFYFAIGLKRLLYKPVPSFYHRQPAQDDLYALFRLGAQRSRCDLSSAINLKHHRRATERRRRSLKKAYKAGVTIVRGTDWLDELWQVLIDNLNKKYAAKPVHAIDEIKFLAERFPDQIRVICALMETKIVAGVVLFTTPTTHHAQYIASNEAGYTASALDAVFDEAIEKAICQGTSWFDFGISNENEGLFLNEGLYRFKNEFGGGGAVYEFYDLELKAGEDYGDL